ncbi:MAG: trypsin-like peptidase domain-containing protein [Thermoguttaceae bacterium]|nr:trypsin-like peptidase domain-containing protein [Thermoguttaceae bacterium]
MPQRPLRRWRLFFLASALCASLLGNGIPPAGAQTVALPAALERYGSVSPEQRAKLYQQLREQARVIEAQNAVVKTVAKLVGPTVVHVAADVTGQAARSLAHPRQRVEEAGSGVVVELDGKFFVLTNCHVIAGSTSDGIRVTLADGRTVNPVNVWRDPETDVAVMAVNTPGLVAAPIGDSSKLEIGDFVLAVGSPFGLSHSVTYGIISAKGRWDLELGAAGLKFQDFLQTDAAINPGNSGGPLINLQGEVIGINTAIASNSGGSEGIGFSIPINTFMLVARQLIQRGTVARAFLGVEWDQGYGAAMAAELGLPRLMGARLTRITPNSPAAKAGLMAGDVILQFNDIPIEDGNHLVNLVNLTEIGRQVSVMIFRERRPMTISVQLADRSQFGQ